MKTSPELLKDILGVVVKISQQIESASPDGVHKETTTSKIKGIFGLGKVTTKDADAVSLLANSVAKLNKELDKTDDKKLEKLISSVKQYNEITANAKEQKAAHRKGMAAAAADVGTALALTGAGMVAMAGAFAMADTLLGIKPVPFLGLVALTGLTLAITTRLIAGVGAPTDQLPGSFGIMKINGETNLPKTAAESAKDTGLALAIMGASMVAIAGSLFLTKQILGVNSIMAAFGIIVLVSVTLVLSMLIVSGADTGTLPFLEGERKVGGAKPKEATKSARDMGIALMLIAGGVLAMSITLALLPKVLNVEKDDAMGILIGMGVIVGVVAAVSGIFFLLGKFGKEIAIGVLVGAAVAIGMAFLAAGVMEFANTATKLKSLGDPSATNKKKEERGMFGQIMAGIGPGLGMMGVILVSSILFFAALGGLAVLSMGLGALVIGSGIAIALGAAETLISISKSIVTVSDTLNKVGGTEGLKTVNENIELMISGITQSVIKGVMGGMSPDGTGKDGLSVKDIRRFRRVKKVVKILSKISTSLGKFAKGLTAFAKIGEIALLDYVYDEEGDVKAPKIGEKIHVATIAHAITDTFGVFITDLVKNTESLTRRQARAIKKLGKSLTGDRGILQGVLDFSKVLQEFAQYGALQEIWVPRQYINPDIEDDAKRNAISNIVKGTGESVPIQTVSNSIIETFNKFISMLTSNVDQFDMTGSGNSAKKMRKLSVALMGKRGWFGAEKPGILDAITDFTEMLAEYAKFGKNNQMPIIGPDGKATGEVLSVTDIAKNMVSGISAFIDAFTDDTNLASIETKSKTLKSKITSISEIFDVLNKIAKSSSEMTRFAESVGSLATNIGLLVTNLDGLNTDKLSSLSSASVPYSTSTTDTTTSTKKSKRQDVSSQSLGGTNISAADWEKIGEIIANKLSAKLSTNKHDEFRFTFYDGASGGKLELR